MNPSMQQQEMDDQYQNYDDNSPYENYTGDDEDYKLLKMKYKQSSNKVYHDFFKTKMCSLYSLSICKKGKECPFAHSPDELREKPNLYKTKLCETFLQTGNCKHGEKCNFSHGESELRSTPDLFKTAICNLWTQGKCVAGERCRFAHGYEDLRPAPSHHKFKKNNLTKVLNNNPQTPSPMPNNNNFNQNMYFNQYQYQYNPNMYAYPNYPMQMMGGDMQNGFPMDQQQFLMQENPNYGMKTSSRQK